ncbi:MAG: ABC transporter substrate-binding protein [Anaerolineales bacterium]|nr:MAG: ABC transporter substrate-binding protein [Anaerolineales bacterium]
MKKRILSSLLLLALLAACAPAAVATQVPTAVVEQPTAAPVVDTSISLTDDLGREVTLEAPAARVVSMAPSNTELLFAVGAGDQVVGRDPYSNFPEEAFDITDIGDTYASLNTELILSLEPDLVLAAGITPPEQVDQLEQLGITVYWLGNPTDLEGLYRNLETVGILTGNEQEALAAIDDLSARAEAVLEKVATVTERPTVFYEVDGQTDPSAPFTAGGGTFIDLIINLAGGANIVGSQEGYIAYSIEDLLVADPSVILLGDFAWGATVESVAARAGWGALSAVTNDRVYPFNDDHMSRPGPRLVNALEELALLLHPELFD